MRCAATLLRAALQRRPQSMLLQDHDTSDQPQHHSSSPSAGFLHLKPSCCRPLRPLPGPTSRHTVWPAFTPSRHQLRFPLGHSNPVKEKFQSRVHSILLPEATERYKKSKRYFQLGCDGQGEKALERFLFRIGPKVFAIVAVGANRAGGVRHSFRRFQILNSLVPFFFPTAASKLLFLHALNTYRLATRDSIELSRRARRLRRFFSPTSARINPELSSANRARIGCHRAIRICCWRTPLPFREEVGLSFSACEAAGSGLFNGQLATYPNYSLPRARIPIDQLAPNPHVHAR